jgi:surface antigen
MKNFSLHIIALAVGGVLLVSCSNQFSKSSQRVAGSDTQIGLLSGAPAPNTGSVAGSEDRSMDSLDKSKLYHALDGGIGKATSWDNVATGTEYTVIPTEKISVGGNPYCRRYTITSVKNRISRQMTGTACVSSDGAWHPA